MNLTNDQKQITTEFWEKSAIVTFLAGVKMMKRQPGLRFHLLR